MRFQSWLKYLVKIVYYLHYDRSCFWLRIPFPHGPEQLEISLQLNYVYYHLLRKLKDPKTRTKITYQLDPILIQCTRLTNFPTQNHRRSLQSYFSFIYYLLRFGNKIIISITIFHVIGYNLFTFPLRIKWRSCFPVEQFTA